MSLLVIRTSSMGDVILTLPVLCSLAKDYPDEEIVFVTKKPFDRFICNVPGIRIFLSDHHGRHKGIRSVVRVWSDLRKSYKITAVADLHDVLRSKVLRLLFFLGGCRVAHIRKGRRDKKALIKGRIKKPLKHTVERYCDVLADAGYPVKLIGGPWLIPSDLSLENIAPVIAKAHGRLIGVAPLAKHLLKTWPEGNMIAFLKRLKGSVDCTIFLFGSPDESDRIERFVSAVPGTVKIAGNLKMDEEIALISRLDMMIAMDSSNMHLASAMGIRTVSIWGATHPMAGFSAWGMPEEYQIQIPVSDLTCRPCTIYGKGECRRGDLACLNWLTPDMVFNKITEILNN